MNSQPNNHKPPPKPCAVCGREITWRKKWERDWHNVRYCSNNCRKSGLTDTDKQLESAIITMLNARAANATICPSEAARIVWTSRRAQQSNPSKPTNPNNNPYHNQDQDGWRTLLEPARKAARRLQAQGRVVITQQGRPVDPSTAKGPIRIRLSDENSSHKQTRTS